jgi:hypothetical protein
VWVLVQRREYRRGALDTQRCARLEALPGWTWEPHDAAWEEGFTHLHRFVEREGHCRLPALYRDEEGFKLGRWVVRQRQARKGGELSEERARRLEALPGWHWDLYEATWEEGFNRLLAFIEREGHSRVPGSYRDDGHRLGRWVIKQRALRNRGDLSSDRVQRLEALQGWTWDTVEAQWAARWEEGYAQLVRFAERQGHTRVPQGHHEANGYALGRWVHKQRQRRGRLSEEQRQLLEALPGWTWHPREAIWEKGFAHLERFVKREGHSRVPGAFRGDGGFRLGGWVERQRAAGRRGELSEERIERLEALPGWVWVVKR